MSQQLQPAEPTLSSRRIIASGEMADRIRAFDWSTTPVGPIDIWPDTLLITVSNLLNSRHPMFLWWGPELVQFYNDAYRPSIGDDKHPRALGQNGPDCWPEIWHIIGPQIEAVMTTGEATWHEDQLVPINRNGKLEDVYWTYSYSPVRAPSGEICGTFVVCTETTGRVLADRRLTQMLAAATDGVLTIGFDWSITYLNGKAQRLLAAHGDIIGKNFWQTFPGTVFEDSIYVRSYTAAMDRRVPADFEAWYPAPLNTWYQVNVRPISDGIILFFADITPRKNAEQAIHAERARLFDVLQQAPVFFTLLSGPNHIFEMLNPRYQELIGNRNILGKPVREAIPEAEEQGFIALLDGVYRTGKPFFGRNTTIELARDSSDARDLRYLDFVYQPLREPDHSVSGIIVIGIDITDRRLAEQALLQTEKLAAVGRLASSIAHEINNPLESVTNLLYLAQQSAISPETQRYLATAETELSRVSAIANQTLRFYRQSTKPRPVTPGEFFESTLPLYQAKLLNLNVAVKRRDRTAAHITCFDGEIRQVLSNLIGNAIDAMAATGGRLLLRSRNATNWTTGHRGIVLTVADTGSGMSPATLTRIFEPFFTTKGISGTGLGLWISHEIIQRHGGHLKARSRQAPPSGTVFTLFLPCDIHSPA